MLYGIIGLLAGLLLSNLSSFGMYGWGGGKWGVGGDSGLRMSMSGMHRTLQDKSGENFDRVFLKMMIPHHQGAINMAELAKTNTTREEVKKLAEEIIAAQKKEIEMMQGWQSAWGY